MSPALCPSNDTEGHSNAIAQISPDRSPRASHNSGLAREKRGHFCTFHSESVPMSDRKFEKRQIQNKRV